MRYSFKAWTDTSSRYEAEISFEEDSLHEVVENFVMFLKAVGFQEETIADCMAQSNYEYNNEA